MIPVNVRTRAVIEEERAQRERSFHRERQKAFEVEAQTFKKVIKAIDKKDEAEKELASVLSGASEEVLQALGIISPPAPESAAAPHVDGDAAAPVEGREPGAGDAPVDGSAEAGAADDDRSPDDGADQIADAAGNAVPAVPALAHQEASQPAPIVHTHLNVAKPEIASDDLAERVYAVLDAERSGSVSSLGWLQLMQRTKLSAGPLKKGLDALERTGRIKRVRAAEAGTRTYLMSPVAEAAA